VAGPFRAARGGVLVTEHTKHSRNLIEQALDIYAKTAGRGGLAVDEASFVGGFVACFGIVTGKLPVGLPDGCTYQQVLERVHDHLQRFHAGALARHQDGINGKG
jgi:hypothetical protein